MTRAQYIFDYVATFLNIGKKPRRCLQMCGRFVKEGKVFCSRRCRERYCLETFGEGRGKEVLTSALKSSLRDVKRKAA